MPISDGWYMSKDNGHPPAQYFLRIAEEGSITRAAGLLGIAQPALSRQLQILEDDLGVALFRRTRRGVELTEAGERLRASTAGPLRQLEFAVKYRVAAGTPGPQHPARRAGDSGRRARGTAHQQLTNAFPAAVFSVTVGSTDQLVEAMLKGAVDVALINPVPDERVFYREMLTGNLFSSAEPTRTSTRPGPSPLPTSSHCRW